MSLLSHKIDPVFSRNKFLYILSAFNIFFLLYILTVGYFNRLALDDFAFVGIYREYGLMSPFTYWYDNWQGRFGPQFMTNVMLAGYDLTSSLFFYAVVLSSALVWSIYKLLGLYFQQHRFILLNYSIFLFSAVFLTTFEPSTFFWLCASLGYFGGMAFALFGVYLILKPGRSLVSLIGVMICFIYVGSSAEHIGATAIVLLVFALAFLTVQTALGAGTFRNHILTFLENHKAQKLLLALLATSIAFVFMVLAPGTTVRMTHTIRITDPIELFVESLESTAYVGVYIFYKLPYIIAMIPVFFVFGSSLSITKDTLRIKLWQSLLLGIFALALLIFISNVPVSYAIGHWGPLRSYVFVSFFLVLILFLVGVHAGIYCRDNLINISKPAVVSTIVLIVFVGYTVISEIPLLIKYTSSVARRISTVTEFKKTGRTEPVYVEPLFNPQYVTITDVWRMITFTTNLPTHMTDMPVLTEDISTSPDWRNNHFKDGLDLPFDVYVASPKHQKTETLSAPNNAD